MDIELNLLETRVIACLIEKEISTPEQYPLSLNALTNACNQKSNREPVLELSESQVQQTLDALTKKRLVMEQSGYGSRVPKYQHRFCNTEFGTLKFSAQELGIICELFLRGPQTPGELRTHTARLCKFNDVQETEAVLDHLMERSDGPFVVRLPREPGKRESRYAHLFSGEVQIPVTGNVADSGTALTASERERLELLELRVEELEAELARLKASLERLESGG